jgi:branched-chain amino acid transport system substrate-binding protein
VVDALSKGTFKTVLGEISFDSKGDPKTEGYVVYVWKDGGYDYLKK